MVARRVSTFLDFVRLIFQAGAFRCLQQAFAPLRRSGRRGGFGLAHSGRGSTMGLLVTADGDERRD